MRTRLETTEGNMSIRKGLVAVVSLVVFASIMVRCICPPVATFRGHTAEVFTVVPSPDGKALASMSEHNTFKLWDVATRQERATLRGSYPTFSADGKTLAWVQDRTIRLWDVAKGTERGALGDTDEFGSIALSPDGKTLAVSKTLAGGNWNDQTLTFWDVTTGKERATCRTLWCSSLHFSPDGKTLASGGNFPDDSIKLWDVTTGKLRATLRAPTGGHVESLAFSPDGKILAAGTYEIQLWDLTTNTNTATLAVPGDGAEGLVFSPDGNHLAAVSSSDPEVFLWKVNGSRNPATFERGSHWPRPLGNNHAYLPLAVVFSPDGKLVAFGHDNCDRMAVIMWQVTTVPMTRKGQ
jgi:WD40 repeat protein